MISVKDRSGKKTKQNAVIENALGWGAEWVEFYWVIKEDLSEMIFVLR